MDALPDWIELVEAARDGDREAQAVLLARFEPLVRSTAHRLVDPDRVDDVVQETYTVALQNLRGLRTAAAFPSWLRLIVRKQASRLRADRSERALEVATAVAMPGADPADHAARTEVADVVRLALASARDQDRRLLELRYLAGWTNDELADLLGISTGAVRKRLHDARRRLRPHLEHLNPEEQAMTDHRRHLGVVHRADVDVPPAPGLRPAPDEPTVTGLKVVDALAPIRRGGTIEMTGPAGTGHLVVALELLYRIGRTEHDVACVGVGRTGAAIGSQPDMSCLVTEPGLPGPNAAILAAGDHDTAQAFEAGARLAAGLASEGLDVILLVDRPTLGQFTPAALTERAGLAVAGSVTVVAVNTVDRGAEQFEPMGLDTTLVFSLEHLALGIFPAIDGARSTSTLDITDAARKAKQRLADAAMLRSWFQQAMYVAEEFTGEDGTWLEPDAVEAELTALVR